MQFEQWLVEQEELIDERVDEIFSKEWSITHDPSRPTRSKAEKLRRKEEIKNHLTLSYLKDDINKAFELIYHRMPNTVSQEVWDSVYEEFSKCKESIKTFWEECQAGKHDDTEPLYKILGLSEDTIRHLYSFGESFFKTEEPGKAQVIFGFLTLLVPYVAAFWLALGRSYQFSGQFNDAIEVYQYGKGYDPNLGKFYLFCAECYNTIDDESGLKKELGTLQKLATTDENKELWNQAKTAFGDYINKGEE